MAPLSGLCLIPELDSGVLDSGVLDSGMLNSGIRPTSRFLELNMLACLHARLLAAAAAALALAACSRGTNEVVMAKEVTPIEAMRSGPAADEPVDRPDTRPADLDANALAVAPKGPPPPPSAAPAGSASDPLSAPAPAAGLSGNKPPPAKAVLTLKQLIGDVSPASDADFAPVPTSLGPKGGMYANKQALAAFAKMHDAAKKDGVDLVIISAFRSFSDQKRIWNDKWTGKTTVEGGKLPRTIPDPQARAEKILEFSAMPATSRHHWGTEFDLNDLTNSYFASGRGKAIHDWLSAHAPEFGFCQVYSPKGPDRPRGYNREDWHWSYLPVASRYLSAYPNVVGYERIVGFEGASTAKSIEVIPNYVQSINPDCQR